MSRAAGSGCGIKTADKSREPEKGKWINHEQQDKKGGA